MKLLTFSDLRKVKGITAGKSTLRRLMRKNQFPRAVKLGGETSPSYWDESEIDNWLASKLAERSMAA